MAAQLGRVLWWLGLIVGGGCFLFVWWASSNTAIHYGHASQEDWVIGAAIGAIPISIGRVCRCVLSGETHIVS